jgi:hypothetical protein
VVIKYLYEHFTIHHDIISHATDQAFDCLNVHKAA